MEPLQKHLVPKLNKFPYDIELDALLLHMVLNQWEFMYWISINEVVATGWKKLMNKLKQI